jgi:hypothetical protein
MALKRPPKLTRKEFLRKAPTNPVQGRSGGQRYQSYLTAYQRQHGPAKAQVTQRPLPTIESLLGQVGRFETPAQLEARANRMAGQGIAQQQTMIREEAALMRQEAQDRALSMAAAGRAAAAQNAGLFGMVGGEYNAGAREIANLGTNLSNQMVHTTEADQLAQNAGLATVGAPEMAVGGPAGTNSLAGPTQGAVSAYQFGMLPAQAITSAGEASQFGLAGMVAAQNLRATQEGNAAYVQSVRDADRARSAAVKELAAGRPAEAAKFLQMLQEAQRQQVGLASGLIQQRAGMRQAGFEQGMTRKTFKEQQKQQAFENKLTVRELAAKEQQFKAELSQKAQENAIEMSRIDASASRAWGYLVNKAGQPILKNGKPIPVASYGGGGGKGGLTNYQLSRLMPKAQEAAENFYYGYKVVDGKKVPANQAQGEGGEVQGELDYGPALTRLTRMGVPKATAQSMLNEYYLPAESGRPAFTGQEKSALLKHYGPKHYKWFVKNIEKAAQEGDRDQVMRWYNLAMSGRNPGWSKLKE